MIRSTEQTLFRLDNLNAEQQRISYQMSTGRKLQQGSDNSNLYAREIYVDDKISVYKGLKVQIERTNAQNNVSDSILADAKDLLSYVKSEVLKALNSTTDDNARISIAINLEGVKENLLMLANEQVEGEYLFAGSDTSVKPFVMDATGSVRYMGDDELRKIAVEEGSYRDRGVTGRETFDNSTVANAGESLEFSLDERIYDQDGNEWELKNDWVAVIGTPLAFNNTYDLIDNNGTYWDLDESVPQLVDISGNTIPLTGGGPGYAVNLSPSDGIEYLKANDLVMLDSSGNQTATFVKINQNAEGNLSIDTPSTTGSKFETRYSVFETLDNIINALKKVDSSGTSISDTEAKAVLESGLTSISEDYDRMNLGHAKLGARNKVFEISYERVSAKLTQYNILSQEIGAADLSKVAVEAKALELTYTALYSTINKMNELSLVNFIR